MSTFRKVFAEAMTRNLSYYMRVYHDPDNFRRIWIERNGCAICRSVHGAFCDECLLNKSATRAGDCACSDTRIAFYEAARMHREKETAETKTRLIHATERHVAALIAWCREKGFDVKEWEEVE